MASRRSGQRPEHMRAAIADEAARIMLEQSLGDYRAAKSKAVERLGLGSRAPLPGNGEIEAALAERNRLFRPEAHASELNELRQRALALMNRLDGFQPRLVGAVLSGNLTGDTTIELQLFADAPESVSQQLDQMGLPWRPVLVRLRWRAGEVEQVPGFRFQEAGNACLVSVIPDRRRGHRPLSPIDGRPMQRAGARQLAQMLAEAGEVSAC